MIGCWHGNTTYHIVWVYLLLFMYTHSMLGAHGLRWYCVHTNDTVPMLHLGLQRANRVTLPYSVYIFALLVCLFVR